MASSLCSAFRKSGSSWVQGQFLMAECFGGGSSGNTSSRILLTLWALIIAAPWIVRPCAACSSPMAQSASRGSLPCRKTDVSRSSISGIKAAGLTTLELKWPLDVRNRARFSSSATISGNPEGSIAVGRYCGYTLNDSFRDLLPIKASNRMTLVRSIQPSKG